MAQKNIMSKLLKSKILLGVMIVAVMIVAVGVLTPVAKADCDLGSATLRQGMRSEAVTCLQTKLGMTTVTGYFGTMTKAAVMAYQANHSLTADGIVGPLTRATLGTQTIITPPVTTVDLCPNGMTLASNCTLAPAGATGTLCPNGNLVANNCAPGTVPAPSGAGDLTITNSTAGVESEVLEGATDTPVLSFKAQATGSSINVTNVKVSLTNTDTAGTSTRLERFASEVSVYMGATKVGSALVSDFSKTGIVYTKNIPLTGATVAVGNANKQTFWIDITALPSIDSADIAGDDWTMRVDSTRWMDGTGMVMSDTTAIAQTGTDLATGVSFSSLSSGELKLTVSKGSGMPVAGNVKVSSTTTTDVLVNQFKLKAAGSKMTVNSISLAISTPTGAIASIVNDMYIKVGGTQVATNDTTLTDSTEVFTLDDPMEIAQDATVTFDVYAKIVKIANGFNSAGNNLLVSYSTSNVEDVNGDAIPGGNRVGTAVGNTQNFYADGINLTFVSQTATPHYSTAPATTPDSGTFVIKFDVANFGDTDLYIDRTTADVDAATANAPGQGVRYEVYKNGAAAATNTTATYVTASASLTASSSTGTDTATDFIVLANSTRHLTLTVSFALEATAVGGGGADSDGFYRVLLDSVNWGTADDNSNADYYSSNLGDYQTDDITLSDYVI
ncbi:hypothetical protein D4R99_02645 [bacterium]|nr:MAG: hypothetical protein D4R99_02645 [bacterium]